MLILASTVTGCVSFSAFASLVCTSVGIVNSVIGTNIWAIIAEIKKYKSIIKRKRKKHDEIVLLEASDLDTIEVSVFKSLIESFISHYEFVSINIMKWKIQIFFI